MINIFLQYRNKKLPYNIGYMEIEKKPFVVITYNLA